MRFKHEIKRASIRPDITPMIDVVFLLLIFFMLSSQFVYSTKIKVELPKARTATITQENIVSITITKDGNLFIDDKTLSFSDLDKILKTMRDGRISIIADKQTDFGMVIKVWDHARDNGIKEINIETKQ